MQLFTFRVPQLLLAALLTAGTAQAQSWEWATLQATSRFSRATQVTTDPLTGNTVVGGYFTDTLVCGGTQLISAGGNDVFVGQLNPTGQWMWAARLGGPADDNIAGIAVGPNSEVVVSGLAGQHAWPFAAALDSAQHALFVAQFSSTGQFAWVTGINAENTLGDPTPTEGGAVAVDAAGRIFLAGMLPTAPTQVDFGIMTMIDSVVGCHNFMVRITAAGTLDAVTMVAERTRISHLTISNNRLFAAGADIFDDGPGGGGPPDPINTFVAAYDLNNGMQQWYTRDITAQGEATTVSGLAADAAGRVYVAASTESLYVSAFAADSGNVLWTQVSPYNGQAGASITGMASSPTGELTVVANLPWIPCICDMPGDRPPVAAVEFPGGPLYEGIGGLVMRFDGATGHLDWQMPEVMYFSGVADDGNGHTRVVGNFGDDFNLVPDGDVYLGPATYHIPSTASGSNVFGVAQLSPSGPLLRALSLTTAPAASSVVLTGHHFTGATQLLVGGVSVAFTVVNDFTITWTAVAGLNGFLRLVAPQGTAAGLFFTTATPLAVAAEARTPSLALWPNPAQGNVQLTIPGAEAVTVEVLDPLGRVVMQAAAVRHSTVLAVGHLPAGLYLVRAGQATARLVIDGSR